MRKNADGFIELDPAIAATLSQGERRQAERGMNKAERKSAKRERAKAEARRGARALYDLAPTMIEAVQTLAREYETSASQIAKLAIWMFLNAVRDGEVDIRAYRVLANKNPKYPYVIELPENE